MRHGIGADHFGDFDLPLGNERAGDGGAEQILALIHRIGAEHREDEILHEGLAQILDENLLDAEQLRLGAGRLQLLALAEVGGEGHHLAMVGVLQPAQNDRGIQPAGVGEDDFFDCMFHGGLVLSWVRSAKQAEAQVMIRFPAASKSKAPWATSQR